MIKPSGDRAAAVVRTVMDFGIDGKTPGLKSSRELADEYLGDAKYADHAARVRSLIRWEASKTFTSGFLTGLGGAITMPVTVPSALTASWVLQARLAGAVAAICGHDVEEDRVRTLALLAIVGDSGKEVAKRVGIDLSQRVGKAALNQVPGKALIEINKQIGFRLLTKAGTRGVVNLADMIPVLGGVVGGSFDLVALRAVGRAAWSSFEPPPQAESAKR